MNAGAHHVLVSFSSRAVSAVRYASGGCRRQCALCALSKHTEFLRSRLPLCSTGPRHEHHRALDFVWLRESVVAPARAVLQQCAEEPLASLLAAAAAAQEAQQASGGASSSGGQKQEEGGNAAAGGKKKGGKNKKGALHKGPKRR